MADDDEVLDYSAGLPGAAAIKRAGYIGAVRYIGLPGYAKNTSKAELDDFLRNDLGMALVFEHFDDDWTRGYDWGRQKYRQARNHADAIGFPTHRPIYMAVDRDVVTAADFQACRDYLRGARDEAGSVDLVGEYGEHDVCAMAANEGLTAWHWQTRAWSGTPVKLFAGRHLYQYPGTVNVGGIGCDINAVVRPDWGQHTASASKAAPIPEGSDDAMIFVGVFDHDNNRWVDDNRYLLNGGLITGGFTSADVDAARADARNGTVAVLGLRHEVFTDLRVKSDTILSNAEYGAKLVELTSQLAEVMSGIGSGLGGGAPVDVKKLASAIADETDRRERDGDPATGSPS